jgi:Flp pilus assembly protein TadG
MAPLSCNSRSRPTRRNLLGRLRLDRRGVAAVEFAIVLPVFLMLLAGIIAYGIYIGAVHSTAQLAADAARTSVAGLNDAERRRIAIGHVQAHASSYPLLSEEAIEVDAGPSPADASEFRVVVRYDAKRLPIWAYAGFLPLPSRTIEGIAVIRRGGF